MSERILQATAVTLTATFTVDGMPTDPAPATATVEIVRDDGTVLVPAGTATTHPSAGVFGYTLTANDTAQLDRLTARWTTANLGTIATSAEIVGGFLFTISEARARGLTSQATADIVNARTRVEQAIEDACGLAFVPRYERATLSGDGTSFLRVGRPFLRRVRWASTSTLGITATLTTADIAGLTAVPYGFVTGGYRWMSGSLVTVGFEHGMDRPPEPVRAAALDYARFLLTQATSVDSRAERLITEDGTLVFGGGATGLPSVDRVIDAYRIPVLA